MLFTCPSGMWGWEEKNIRKRHNNRIRTEKKINAGRYIARLMCAFTRCMVRSITVTTWLSNQCHACGDFFFFFTKDAKK